jgi:hypothetical protein
MTRDILVSVRVILRGSYVSLYAGFPKSSYFVYLTWIFIYPRLIGKAKVYDLITVIKPALSYTQVK